MIDLAQSAEIGLTISTAHLTPEDCRLLGKLVQHRRDRAEVDVHRWMDVHLGEAVATPVEDGWSVRVFADAGSQRATEHGMSDAFVMLLAACRAAGVSHLRLDVQGSCLDGVPTYDWL